MHCLTTCEEMWQAIYNGFTCGLFSAVALMLIIYCFPDRK